MQKASMYAKKTFWERKKNQHELTEMSSAVLFCIGYKSFANISRLALEKCVFIVII